MLKPAALLFGAGDRLLPLLAHLPFAMQRLSLEASLNRLFAEPLGEGAFDILDGRWLQLRIPDLGLGWFLTQDNGRLRIARQAGAKAEADVRISGNWREFLLLASRQEDPDTLFFRRRLVIEGDTELGLAVKNLIDSLDPDQLPPLLWRLLQGAGQRLTELAQGEAATGRG